MTEQPAALHSSSTGLTATDATWLDLSFASSQPEYEAALRSVGVQAGWHVLDAGCGSGSFLPLLSELVGPNGVITALDLAPDNIAVIQERLAQRPLACPVHTEVGSILELPFEDDTFDAVWVAQVLIYLSDEECRRALAEFRRVVRRDGLIAAKESSGPQCPYPVDPAYWFPVYTHALKEHFPGARRSCALSKWFDRAGFESIQQHAILHERSAPLDPITHRARAEQFALMAEMAEAVDLPSGGREFWILQRDPESPDALGNHPDLATCAIDYVATGRVAGAASQASRQGPSQ